MNPLLRVFVLGGLMMGVGLYQQAFPAKAQPVSPAGAAAEVDPCPLGLGFDGIPVARTVEESQALLPVRINRVVGCFRKQALGKFPNSSAFKGRFVSPALARVLLGDDINAVNAEILQPGAQPFGEYGTNFTILPGPCQRQGDYDFTADNLVRLAYTRPGTLSPEAYQKLRDVLLPEAGNTHYSSFRICGIPIPETENHILMTESARYLTNQLRFDASGDPRYNNETNGFNAWLRRKLQSLVMQGFEEYNSRPYQGFSTQTIGNLYSYAQDAKVRTAAQIVLDYLTATFAVQSNGLRRVVPFRRHDDFASEPRTWVEDTEATRFALLAGNYEYLRGDGLPAERKAGKSLPLGTSTEDGSFDIPAASYILMNTVVSAYRVPDLLLDLMIRKDHNPYFQTFHHRTVELYSSSKSYLISAGGIAITEGALPFNSEQYGWARPTTLMPSADLSSDHTNWIRFEGHRDRLKKQNHCVATNFACGVNLKIPVQMPPNCVQTTGNWKFFNFASSTCPLPYGFYAAIYEATCDSAVCSSQGENFGFLEVREAEGLPFEEFRDRVLSQNQDKAFGSNRHNTYRMSTGTPVTFEPITADAWTWSIVALDGKAQNRNIKNWPLAKGDVVNSRGRGKVEITNRFLKQRLVLDLSNPDAPVRREESL